MEKISLKTAGALSEIYIGAEWQSVSNMIPGKGSVIITDRNVSDIYGENFPEMKVLVIEPGEDSKRLAVIEKLAGDLLHEGIDRSGFILAIGGGVVCDIAGFLASVYLRGIRCGYVSSSLLAQVDASTGGKNGVNLGGTKNIIGVIRQPDFVICDPVMLLTLPEDEYLSGLAELIKTSIIGDKELFEMLESNYESIMARDIDLLTVLVTRSVKFKASVVSADEKEAGLRRILNFGHTYGHAIEMQMGIKHGFAVASGMEMATSFSFEKGLIDVSERDRIINILIRYGLLTEHKISDERIEELILHDKKKSGSELFFVYSDGIGSAIYEKVPVIEVLDFYRRFRDKKLAI